LNIFKEKNLDEQISEFEEALDKEYNQAILLIKEHFSDFDDINYLSKIYIDFNLLYFNLFYFDF